jgi:nicotinamidase-related amidase
MTQALLIMDVQNAILDRFGPADDYLDRVVAAQAKAEDASLPVVLVRVGFTPGYPEVSPHNAMFGAIRSSGAMQLGDAGCEPHDRLLRGRGEIVVTKKRVSAFTGSDVTQVLRAHDVDHLVLGGISTSGVVLSTVREAADRDYRLTVLSDLCLDGDDEVHRVLIEKVFPRQAEVMTSTAWSPTGSA